MEQVMFHGCDKDDLLNLGRVLAECWEWASQLLPNWDSYTRGAQSYIDQSFGDSEVLLTILEKERIPHRVRIDVKGSIKQVSFNTDDLPRIRNAVMKWYEAATGIHRLLGSR
jgi:hypothetical protein